MKTPTIPEREAHPLLRLAAAAGVIACLLSSCGKQEPYKGTLQQISDIKVQMYEEHLQLLADEGRQVSKEVELSSQEQKNNLK